VGLLTLFFDRGVTASLLGFGLFLGRIALGLGFVLLGLVFTDQVVTSGDGADRLLVSVMGLPPF
jgi:hypothetical protein